MAKIDTTKMHQIVIAAAEKYGVPVDLALAMISAESGFNPNAKSQVGAIGLGQLMPATARGLGVKDPYNPVQNADGSMRYLKAKLDEFGGNVDLALAAYNAGSGAVRKYRNKVPPYKETQNYVKTIKANRNKYAKIASNSSKVPADMEQATLQGKVTMNEQNDNNNNANSASDMIMSSLDSKYYINPTNPVLNNRDLLTSGGSKQTQLMDIATKIRPDAKAQLQLYLNGLMSFEELNAKYPKMVQELGLTKDTERKSPYSPYTTKLLDDMYNKIMPTDEQIRQAQQNVAQQNKQTIDAYNQQRDALTKVMNDAYNKQVNTISKNPYGDLAGQVQIDSEALRRARLNDMRNDLYYARQGKANPIIKDEDILMSRLYAQRDAQLANKYGISPAEAKQIAATQYNNQVAAAKQNVENAKIQYYYGNISAQQLMKVLQENNNTINNARANATKQYSDLMGKVMPEMIQQDAETARRVLQNQGAVDTQAMQNAGSIVNSNINANNDRDIARYEGEVSQRGQDINANTQVYNTNVGAVTDAAKLQQNQSQFKTMAPYKQFGTMAPMGYIPNVDLGGTAQNLGIPVQLRQNFQPDRVTNNSPLQTGFQGATARFLNRFIPNANQEDNQ